MTDSALEEVVAELLDLDPDGSRMATTIRNTLDQLYDGQHTGRYRWDQLHKTEKTHCGTLVEINLQRDFFFRDGDKLDYEIAGHEVDCKYSQSMGGWMVPNEAHNELCLVVTASDTAARWSAGVVRMKEENLGAGRNRDAKRSLSPVGRADIRWLQHDAELPPNILLMLSQGEVDQIFEARSGQKRINQLFRTVQGQRITRGVIATVAQQDDYMKRVRENGGARTHLRKEGIVILGEYQAHRQIARQLGVVEPQRGECVSVRLCRAEGGVEINGGSWAVATDADPVVEAPVLPKVSVVS
ncbi:NaeI family type II restriction endonuclease [Nocardioides sp. WV_118_6]